MFFASYCYFFYQKGRDDQSVTVMKCREKCLVFVIGEKFLNSPKGFMELRLSEDKTEPRFHALTSKVCSKARRNGKEVACIYGY